MSLINDIKWSDEVYSPLALNNKYGNQMPLFILISRGRQGLIDANGKFSDQVARVKRVVKQERVLVSDVKGNFLSFPADFPIKMHIIGSKKTRTMKEIMSKTKNPVQVQFDYKKRWTFHVNGEPYTTENFGFFFLQRRYLESFLCCNIIQQDHVDSGQTLLALGVDVKIQLAQGLKNGSTQQWVAVQNKFNHMADKIYIKEKQGTKAIFRIDENNPVLTQLNIKVPRHAKLDKQMSSPMGTTVAVPMNNNNDETERKEFHLISVTEERSTVTKTMKNEVNEARQDETPDLYAVPKERVRREETIVSTETRISSGDDEHGPQVPDKQADVLLSEEVTQTQESQTHAPGDAVVMETVVVTETVTTTTTNDKKEETREEVAVSRKSSVSSSSSSDGTGVVMAADRRSADVKSAEGTLTPASSQPHEASRKEDAQTRNTNQTPQQFKSVVAVQTTDESRSSHESEDDSQIRRSHDQVAPEDHVMYNASNHTRSARAAVPISRHPREGEAYRYHDQVRNGRPVRRYEHPKRNPSEDPNLDRYRFSSLPRNYFENVFYENAQYPSSLRMSPRQKRPPLRSFDPAMKPYGTALVPKAYVSYDYGSVDPYGPGRVPSFYSSQDFSTLPPRYEVDYNAVNHRGSYPPRVPALHRAPSLSGFSVASGEAVSVIDVNYEDDPEPVNYYDSTHKIFDVSMSKVGARGDGELYKSHIYLAPVTDRVPVDATPPYTTTSGRMDFTDARPVSLNVGGRHDPTNADQTGHSAQVYAGRRTERREVERTTRDSLRISTGRSEDNRQWSAKSMTSASGMSQVTPVQRELMSPASGDLVISTFKGDRVIQQDYIRGDNPQYQRGTVSELGYSQVDGRDRRRDNSPPQLDGYYRRGEKVRGPSSRSPDGRYLEEVYMEPTQVVNQRVEIKRTTNHTVSDQASQRRHHDDNSQRRHRDDGNSHRRHRDDDNSHRRHRDDDKKRRHRDDDGHRSHRDERKDKTKSSRSRRDDREKENEEQMDHFRYETRQYEGHDGLGRSHSSYRSTSGGKYDGSNVEQGTMHYEYAGLDPEVFYTTGHSNHVAAIRGGNLVPKQDMADGSPRQGSQQSYPKTSSLLSDSSATLLSESSEEENYTSLQDKNAQHQLSDLQKQDRYVNYHDFDPNEDNVISESLGYSDEEENPYSELSEFDLVRRGLTRREKTTRRNHRASMPSDAAPAPPVHQYEPPPPPPLRSDSAPKSSSTMSSGSNTEAEMQKLFGGMIAETKMKAFTEMKKIDDSRLQNGDEESPYERPVVTTRSATTDIPQLPTSTKHAQQKKNKPKTKAMATTALISSLHTADFSGSDAEPSSRQNSQRSVTTVSVNNSGSSPRISQSAWTATSGPKMADSYRSPPVSPSSNTRVYPAMRSSEHDKQTFLENRYNRSGSTVVTEMTSTPASKNYMSSPRSTKVSQGSETAMESFHDSIRDLDDYLHEQDPDSMSLSSVISARYRNHMSLAQEGETQL